MIQAEGKAGALAQGGRLPRRFETQQEGSSGQSGLRKQSVEKGRPRGNRKGAVKVLWATVRMLASTEGDGSHWRFPSSGAVIWLMFYQDHSFDNRLTNGGREQKFQMGGVIAMAPLREGGSLHQVVMVDLVRSGQVMDYYYYHHHHHHHRLSRATSTAHGSSQARG